MRTIGAYQARTHLPRLLDEVAEGATITITKHGSPVAVLVPPPGARHTNTDAVIKALKDFRRGNTLGGLTVRDLIDEGRRS